MVASEVDGSVMHLASCGEVDPGFDLVPGFSVGLLKIEPLLFDRLFDAHFPEFLNNFFHD
jgi:hypothetical protein